jgi:hypothetical protein
MGAEAEVARPQRARILVRRSPATDAEAGEGANFQSRTVREVPATEPNELEDLNLADWLGGRDLSTFAKATADSNPR